MICDKNNYTLSEAQQACKGLNKRKGQSFRFYKCPDGDHYHIATIRKHNPEHKIRKFK